MFTALLFTSLSALAQSAPLDQTGHIGVGLGGNASAVGISARFGLDELVAVQGVLGGHPDGGLGLSGDLLLPQPTFWTSPHLQMAWSLGAGAEIALSDRDHLALRGVLAWELLLQDAPVELALELRPGVRLLPHGALDLISVGAAARWWL
ncbi:MAG: hypothetical protein JXX28_00315 [Deltaproteobacteria bacterium]|nr:hypothetical protein [Deltaproteobacteria bacterium]